MRKVSSMKLANSFAMLAARVILGVILIAHGWQKFSEWTIAGTTQSFEGMGVPAASIAAPAAAIIELVGVIAAAGLMLVAAGPGMHSLDQLFFSKKAKVASKATTSQPLASPIEVRGIF